jgi:hypothetical protein
LSIAFAATMAAGCCFSPRGWGAYPPRCNCNPSRMHRCLFEAVAVALSARGALPRSHVGQVLAAPFGQPSADPRNTAALNSTWLPRSPGW